MSDTVAALLGLEQQLRKASDLAQLFYTLVNQTHACVPYTQAILLVDEKLQRPRVEAVSDLPAVDYTSPFISWIERLNKALLSHEQGVVQRTVRRSDVDADLANEWKEFGAPDYLLWQPLLIEAKDNEATGVLLLFREQDWSEMEKGICQHIGNSAGHAIFALKRHQPLRRLWPRLRQRKVVMGVAVALVVLMAIPVRLSTLAPVQVIPSRPHVVAAPLDGVIEYIQVQPNQEIQQGDVLAQLEEGELSSEASIARQSFLLAQAELKTVQQSGFMDPRQKARLAELEAQVKLQALQWEHARDRLEKAHIRSEIAGVAVLDDPMEWRGRPVKVGERIMLVADPEQIELEIMLPVKDSIVLSPGADIKVFLDNDPIHAWSAVLRHAAYEPRSTATQEVAYRLIADLTGDNQMLPRIGLKGTAKIYGERVSLFFYLFRRPLTSLRQWIGW